MKKYFLFTIMLLIMVPGFMQAEQPELGKYPKILKSGNYTITMLRIGKDDSVMLIKVDGIDNNFDGQIFKHTKICENTNCTAYKYETVEIPGHKRWWTIQITRSWGDYDNIVFYPPGVEKKHDASESKRPDSFDPTKFYNEYKAQLAKRK